MPQADIGQLLEPTIILRDCFDSVCSSVERIIATIETCQNELKPYGEFTLSDQEAVQNILEALPQKNASALIAAIMGLTEFVPLNFATDTDELMVDLIGELERLQRVRDNLHAALEGLP